MIQNNLFLLSYFIATNIFAQNIYVKDNFTKKVLPYTSIQFIGKDKGLYTNDEGFFSLENIRSSDSLFISHLGYQSLKLKAKSITDTIYLEPKNDILSEVIIPVGSPKKKIIGLVHNRKDFRWPLRKKQEFSTLIAYEKKYNLALIKKIFIPISKSSIEIEGKNDKYDAFYPNFSSIIKINIFSNIDNKIGKPIISSPIFIKCNQKSPKKLEIDLSANQILFPKEGVFISVEIIHSEIHDEGIKYKIDSSKLLPSFKFSNKTRKNIITKSYVKGFFKDDNSWVSIKDGDSFMSDYNLALGLELYIYD